MALQVAIGIVAILVGDGAARIGQRPHTALTIRQIVADRAPLILRQQLAVPEDVVGLDGSASIRLQHHVARWRSLIPEVVGRDLPDRLADPPSIGIVRVAGAGAAGYAHTSEP